MMDNLQEAYTAYQQALYHLQDPKVRPVHDFIMVPSLIAAAAGTKAVVRDRHTLRSVRIP